MFGAEFFPTPKPVIEKMLAKIDKNAQYFLEPSAGKGDIAQAIFDAGKWDRYGTRSQHSVDCIEANPELCQILQGKGFPVVGFDWLEYPGVCYYDAVVMNPPFSNAATHLLKAWDFMHDGEIVCLVNEETIKNPYSAERERLAALIAQHGNVEWLGDCFASKTKGAERTAAVNVAMVYLKKVSDDDTVEMWAKDTPERDIDDSIGEDPNILALRDDLGNMEHWYNSANEHMLKAFAHLRKASLYLSFNKIDKSGDAYEKVVGLAMKNVNSARAEFSRKHRRDAWMQVFERMEFRKWLDKKQTDEFIRDIERSGDVPFTKENIKATLRNVFGQRNELFNKSVANVFDELTRYYNGNTNGGGGGTEGRTGWKTNDSYKVNEKLVFPYGLRYESKYQALGPWGMYYGHSSDIYSDLDRIMCVLAGEKFEECFTIGAALSEAFDHLNHPGRKSATRWYTDCDLSSADLAMKQQARSDYFDIRFFKKGTVHLKFRDADLWEKFCIAASKGKNWIGENTRREREGSGCKAVAVVR